MKKALTRGVAVTLTAAMALTIPAYAAESDNYYVKVTNTDGSDPVYVELTDENSTVTDTGRVLNEDQKEEGKTYEAVTTTSEDVTVYEIGDEITDVNDMEVGSTYNFATGDSAEGIETGDVLTEALEGGAVLTYTGDGTDYEYPSSYSVVSIYRSDVNMVSNLSKSMAEDSEYAAEVLEKYSSGEDMMNKEFEEYLPSIQQRTGYENVTSLADYAAVEVSRYSDYYMSRYGVDTQEEAAAVYYAYMLADYDNDYAQYVKMANYDPDTDPYSAMAEEMSAVINDSMTDEEKEAAILAYVGLTKEEYLAKKGAWNWSNSPVVANSGTVDVVQAGTGFDGCKRGVIFYDEALGWSYACVNGGVAFGDATGMSLYNVTESVLDPDAFSVTAGEAVQLDADGNGTAGAGNFIVTCTLPNGEVSNLLTYDIADSHVDKADNHATVLLNGRYYTVRLDVLKLIVWGDWKILTTATCTENGLLVRTNNDGESESQVIPATGHSWSDWTTTPATCTGDGIKTRTCSVCGLTEVEMILAAGHSFGDWEVTKEAAVGIEGEQVRTCSVCGETETEAIPALTAAEEMTVTTVSRMINSGSFSGIVKDEAYADAAYHSEANVEDNILTVTADLADGAGALRRLILDEDVVSAMKEANVEKLVFIVGDYTFTITADQLYGLTDVVINIDPANGECTILVNQEDRTEDFEFTCEKN